MIRIGIVGAGAVAGFHAQAALENPDTQLTAVCDLNTERAAAIAGPYDAHVFDNFSTLVASDLVDAIIVNTPHSLHEDMACQAADAQLAILMEKPLSTTVESCDRIVEYCQSRGVYLQVGHIQHFMPDKIAAKRAIDEGKLGEIVMVHDFRTTNYRPGARPAWFFDKQIAGGGALMNIGAHCLDRTTWLAGAQVESLEAVMFDRFGVGVETDGILSLRLVGNIPATITVVSDLGHPVDEITVVGSLGTLVANPRTGTTVKDERCETTLHIPSDHDIADAFRYQLDDFVRGVSTGVSAVSNEHSRHVIDCILRAYSAASPGDSLNVGAQ